MVLHENLLEIRINRADRLRAVENSQFEGRDGNRGGRVLSLVDSDWGGRVGRLLNEIDGRGRVALWRGVSGRCRG